MYLCSVMEDRWVVWMPCKGYVKRWLLANFNRPDEKWPEIVNLGADKVLLSSFYNHLRRNYTPRGEQRDVSRRYTEQVAIEYTKTAFDRYGWSLTDKELVEFNNELEARVRLLMRNYVMALRCIGVPVGKCIQSFREMTGITEWDWSDDSIRRDLVRHIPKGIDDDFGKILLKVKQNFCAQMTKLGQLTRQGYLNYSGSEK